MLRKFVVAALGGRANSRTAAVFGKRSGNAPRGVGGFKQTASRTLASGTTGPSVEKSGGSGSGGGSGGGNGGGGSKTPKIVASVVAAVAAGGLMMSLAQNRNADAAVSRPGRGEHGYDPILDESLPIFTMAEVAEHTDPEKSVWVTFDGGVYDVTEFIRGHPGGSGRLMMAAGQDMAPFWEVYRQHYRGHVIPWMTGSDMLIGRLPSREIADQAAKAFAFDSPYDEDPPRDPDLLGTTQKPWCGEPRLSRLAEHFYTPNELFYVRNHLPVPVIDADEWELTVRGNGVTERRFTLNDLKTKFQKHEVVSTLQCAGNRREDMHAIEQPDGEAQVFISPHWVSGAVSNAKWGGVRLRDVLRECGVDVDAMAFDNKKDPLQRHVQWSSYDADETGNNYGSSIPIEKAIDPRGDVLLAWEMNGEPLPRDHGFPVRALVPGHAGARQAKWLAEVIIAEEESPRHWQQKAYRGFAPDVRFQKGLYKWKDIRLDQAPIVQEMPVQSLICHPENNSSIPGKNSDGSVVDSVKIRGVAWSGGGAGIARVDVSTDGGPNFSAAELYTPIEQEWRRKWAWYLFEKEFPLTEEQKRKIARGEKIELECVSKAADGAFNVQPERPEPYYNARGVAINNWYRVRVTIDPKIAMETSDPNAQFGNTPTSGTFHQPWQGHGWTGAERNEHEKK